jgi:hypothetical protein
MTTSQLKIDVLELLGRGPVSCDAGDVYSALRRIGVQYEEIGPRFELLRGVLRVLRHDGLTEIVNGQLRLVEIRQSIRPLVWASPPMRFGKHEWRVVVVLDTYQRRVMSYEWRPVPHPLDCAIDRQWRDAPSWPRYRHAYGEGRLPVSVRRLYDHHALRIAAMLQRAEG